MVACANKELNLRFFLRNDPNTPTLHKKVKDINILNFLVPFIYAVLYTRARIACIKYTKKLRIFISLAFCVVYNNHPLGLSALAIVPIAHIP